MTMWVASYLGEPYSLWVDQARSFLSVQFKTLVNSLECNFVPITAKTHLYLVAEWYHHQLRRIENKQFVDHPAEPLSHH